MKKEWLVKTLAMGIVVLFIGINTIPIIESLSIEKQAIQESFPFTYSAKDTSGISLITIQVAGEIGLNNWFTSEVAFNFTNESEDIASIYYNIYDNEWTEYIEPFVISDEGVHTLKWYAVDYEENTSDVDGPFFFDIDQTDPEIALEYEVIGGNSQTGWDILFIAAATDDISGMDRVEFLLNNIIQSTVCGPGPTYQWLLHNYKESYHYSFKATGYDKAGNSATADIVNPSNIATSKTSKYHECISKKIKVQNILNYVLSYEIGKLESRKIIERLPSVYTMNDVFDPAYIIVVFDRKLGGDGWVVSNVSIPIFYEADRIADVFYQINDGGWKVYTEPLVISDDEIYVFSWYVIDSEGYISTPESTSFKIDQTPPKITLVKERLDDKHIKFIANVIDGMSGVWRVEFYLDNLLEYNDIDFPFEWTREVSDNHNHMVKAIVYDMAGNSASSSISTPKSHSIQQFTSSQQIIQLLQNLILHHQMRYMYLRGR